LALERLLDLLDDVEDPRCSGKVEHRLTDILLIAVCAVIACAESWDDIALYGDFVALIAAAAAGVG